MKVVACDKKLPDHPDADDQHEQLLCQYIKLRSMVDVERLMHECHAWRKGWHNELLHSPQLLSIVRFCSLLCAHSWLSGDM